MEVLRRVSNPLELSTRCPLVKLLKTVSRTCFTTRRTWWCFDSDTCTTFFWIKRLHQTCVAELVECACATFWTAARCCKYKLWLLSTAWLLASCFPSICSRIPEPCLTMQNSTEQLQRLDNEHTDHDGQASNVHLSFNKRLSVRWPFRLCSPNSSLNHLGGIVKLCFCSIDQSSIGSAMLVQ